MSGGLRRSQILKLNKIKSKSWFDPRTILRLIVVVADATLDRIPDVRIVKFHPDDARSRQPNVEIPPVKPKRRRRVGKYRSCEIGRPRHYGLRVKVNRQKDEWSEVKGKYQPRAVKERREKARKALEEAWKEKAKEEEVPAHWKNVSDKECLEDYE